MEEKTRYAKVVLVSVALLFCCTISIPAQAGSLSSLREFLGSVPLVVSTDAVGSMALTQVRYSLLTVFLVLVAAMLLLNILLDGRLEKPLHGLPSMICLIVFAAIAVVSGVYFENIADIAKLTVYVEVALSVVWMSAGERRFLYRSLLQLLVVVGVLNALATIAQFAVLSQGVGGVRALRTARPDGLFGDSIISALVCAMAMVAVLCREGFSWKWKTVFVALLGVAGVLTGARSFYYLAAGACALVVVLFTRSSGVRAILCCAVCVVGVSTIVVMVDRISDFEMSVSSASATPVGRELKTMLALQEFEKHPIIGIGTGRYVRAETNYYATVLSKGTTGTNPHNIYLQVLCENGVLGFVPFAGFVGLSLWGLWRQRAKQALSVFALFLVAGMTLGILYSASIAAFAFALVFAGLAPSESVDGEG